MTTVHFVVYMNAKDPRPSQEPHSREALAPVFAELNKYYYYALRRTEHNLYADRRPSYRRSLLPLQYLEVVDKGSDGWQKRLEYLENTGRTRGVVPIIRHRPAPDRATPQEK
jgi:hypothetical protein